MRRCFDALHHLVGVVHRLRERHEEHRPHRTIELKSREAGVAHHADDAEGVDVFGEVQPEVLIDGILVRLEEAAHEGFVHHRHVLGRLVVGGGKVAAAHELDAEVLQVVRAHAIPRRSRLLARRRLRLAGNEDALAPIVGQRVVERERRALSHPGCARAVPPGRGRVPSAARPSSLPTAGPTDTSTRPSRVKPKSWPSRLPRLRPSIVEPGHQHHRERGLQHEQRLAREGCRVAGGSARAAQRFDRIRARGKPRGRGAEEHAGDEREARGERQHQRRRHGVDRQEAGTGERE